MKNNFLLLSVILSVVMAALLPCAVFAQKEEQKTPQLYDSLHVDSDILERIEAEPEDLIIHAFTHSYSGEEGFYAVSQNAHATYKENGYFFLVSAEDGHVETWYKAWGSDEFSKSNADYPSAENSPVALLVDLLQNQKKYFEQEAQIQEIYFSPNEESSSTGTYLYAVTDQGHFMIYKEPSAKANDPAYIFPKKDFEKFDQIHSKECEKVSQNFGVQLNEFTFTKVIEQETTADLTKYQAPFDIDGYELQTSLKTILPIAGGVLVAAAIAVAVILAKNASEREKEAAPTAD